MRKASGGQTIDPHAAYLTALLTSCRTLNMAAHRYSSDDLDVRFRDAYQAIRSHEAKEGRSWNYYADEEDEEQARREGLTTMPASVRRAAVGAVVLLCRLSYLCVCAVAY